MMKAIKPCRAFWVMAFAGDDGKASTFCQMQNMSRAERAMEAQIKKRWHHEGGAKGKGATWWSFGGKVYQGPRLWTGEPANWNNIVGASAEDLDRIQPPLLFNFGPITGASPVLFSPHSNKSYPRLLPLTCCPSVSLPGPRGPQKAEGFRQGLEKLQAPCHWAPYGTSSHLSPWTWPHPWALYSHTETRTHPLTPRLLR